jgi:hypothetical protein
LLVTNKYSIDFFQKYALYGFVFRHRERALPKMTAPSVTSKSFSCPHCGALAHQTWFDLFASEVDRENGLPWIEKDLEYMRAQLPRDLDPAADILSWLADLVAGRVMLSKEGNARHVYATNNIHISKCFSCHEFSVWVFDRVVFPSRIESQAPQPNPDLPQDVRRDFEEARAIAKQSPRSAAALLRLCVQKICKDLGGKGENINSDIRTYIASGGDPRIQKALDIVRIIGNNAVHPGQIDLRDDVDTVNTLFGVVNIIGEKAYTEKRLIDEMFSTLPQSAIDAIKKRDGEG